MKVGVTGTRSGLTDYQRSSIESFLNQKYTPESEFHHGDCVGVDVECAEIAKNIGYRIVCHPPVKDDLRAFFESDISLEPKTYFQRNRNIVDSVDFLIVAPYQSEWQPNGFHSSEKSSLFLV